MSSEVSSPIEVDPLSPGGQLRAAREGRGETVNEAAFALKLNPRQVIALEENDFDALPGMALVRGFMRNYARHLGIDPAPLLESVQQMGGRSAVDLSPIRNAEGDLPSGAARRRTTRWSGWLVAALVATVLAGWYFDWFRTEPAPLEEFSASGPRAELGTVIPSLAQRETAPVASVPSAVPGSPAVEAETPASPATAVPEAAETPAAESAAATEQLGGTEAGAATDGSAAEAVPPASADSADTATPPAATEGLSRLAFTFRGESWVEVREAGGRIVYSGTNRPGTSRTVEGKAPFALVVGNSAQVALEHDGKPVNMSAHTKVSVARFNLP